jgi:hypothetical protein
MMGLATAMRLPLPCVGGGTGMMGLATAIRFPELGCTERETSIDTVNVARKRRNANEEAMRIFDVREIIG